MKKIMILAASAALILSGCSKSEIVEGAYDGVQNNPNAITFGANTTRSADNTITDVREGFQVFGHINGATGTSWYNDGVVATSIDGDYDYKYFTSPSASVSDNAGWQWINATGTAVEAPLWPTDATSYPMSFYAAYPTNELTTPATIGTLTSTITPNVDRFLQEDHLAAVSKPAAMPAGGKLSLVFNHILSKLNVSVSPASGYTVEIQSATFKNVGNSSNSYNYVASTWATPTVSSKDYIYRETVFAGSSTATTTATQYTDPTTFRPLYASSTLASSIVHNSSSSATDGNLMLLPQDFAAVEVATSGADMQNNLTNITSGAYLEVLYRVELTTGGADVVGRKDILAVSGDNPYYNEAGDTKYSSVADVTTAIGSTYPGAAIVPADYASPATITSGQNLYVKALFPLKSKIDGSATEAGVNWAKGYRYIYNLLIGDTGDGSGGNGGYYADNQYYDEAGNGTGLYHRGVEGTPIFAQQYIHFDVTVDKWADGNTTDLE